MFSLGYMDQPGSFWAPEAETNSEKEIGIKLFCLVVDFSDYMMPTY